MYEYIGEGIKPPQVETMAQATGKALTLAGLVQENQMRGLQMRQAQQDFQDQQTMRQAYMESGGDMDKFGQLVMQRGVSPKAIQQIQMQRLTMQKELAGLDETKLKNEKAKNDAFGTEAASLLQIQDPDKRQQFYQTVTKPRLTQMGVQVPDQLPAGDDFLNLHANASKTADQLFQEEMKRREDTRATNLAGPQLEKAKSEALSAGLGTAAQTVGSIANQEQYTAWRSGLDPEVQKNIPAFYSPAAVAMVQRQAVPVKDQPTYDIDQMKAASGMVGNSEFDQFLAKNAASIIGPDGKPKTPRQLTAPEFNKLMQQYKEFNADPVLRAQAIQQKDLQAAMLRLQQGQIPNETDINVMAKSVLDRTLAPAQFAELRSGRMGGVGAKVFAAAKQMDPNFSMTRADSEFKAMEKTEGDFTSGKEATLVRSNNNALEHLALLDKAREALANGNIPLLNSIANSVGVQLGSDAKTTFDHIGQRVGGEVEKAFVPGGGSAGERTAAAGGYSSSMGDTQLKSNIRADIHLLDSQQRNLQDQYTRGTYGQGAQQLYTPQAMAARDQIMGKPAPLIRTKEEFDKLPKGSLYKEENGHTYRKP